MSQIPSPSNHFSGPTRFASELVSMAPTVPALLPPFERQNVWMRPRSGATSTTSTAMPRRIATRASFTLAAAWRTCRQPRPSTSQAATQQTKIAAGHSSPGYEYT